MCLKTLLALVATSLALLTLARGANVPPERYRDFVAVAGNTESDAIRVGHLRKLADQCSRDGVTLPGLDQLISFAERWDSPAVRLDFFDREIRRTLTIDFGIDESSPLHPLAEYYRARALVWACLEYSDIYPFAEKRAAYLVKAREKFEVAAKAFPENRIARMYLGTPLPPARTLHVPPNSPSWAVAQREGLEGLTDIIDWWIDHRLRPNGEYGGGWGDDCEMWRHWVTVLYGFEHPRASWAQAFHSSRLLAQPHLAGGYQSRMMDVEHTSEDVADALTPMMSIAPGNPEWAQRANRLVDLMENLWMGRNERGFLQFKSTYFTDEKVDLTPARACDTVYHPRAIQPALLYWQRTGDARVGRIVTDWMRTWVDATAREERGKPAGIIPTAIHWPDGRIGGVGEKWWLPENYETPLYDFPSAMSLMLNTLVLTYHMSGDAAFLEPVKSMAAARLDWIKAGRPDAPEGSRLWCASKIDQIGGAVAKYRFLTGDTSFDALLREERSVAYVQYRLAGDTGLPALGTALSELATAVRYNFPAYTQEVRYTDRVMRFPVIYQPGWILEKGVPTTIVEAGVMMMNFNRLNLLYNAATGDPGDPLYFPINAVRWKTPPRDIATLVTESNPGRFAARLYHFGKDAREMGAELLLLRPGSYRFRITELGSGREVQRGTVSADRVARFTLPPGRECVLTVEP